MKLGKRQIVNVTVIKKYIALSTPIFCVFYMLTILGPSEIYFANLSEFDFLYQEFLTYSLPVLFFLAALLTVVVYHIPQLLQYIAICAFGGCSLAIYIQVMFLNGNLELLGANPNGFHSDKRITYGNTVIWLAIIFGFVVLCISIKKKVIMMVAGISAFLIMIQTAGLFQLILTADQKAYKREPTEWYLSGDRELETAKRNNVIVISLDYFSNQYIEPMLEEYPDALDCLKDFTYYDNYECVYFGTFPSLAHMLTGKEVDPSITINEWTHAIWESEVTREFYGEAHKEGYDVLFFEDLTHVLVGNNNLNILEGIFDNVCNDTVDLRINSKKLLKTMYRFSLFRSAPYALKGLFYSTDSSVSVMDNMSHDVISPENYDYYSKLKTDGLYEGQNENLLVFRHLSGAHNYTTSAECLYKENSSLTETCRGCMTLIDEYLSQLKALGKYDDATIIITSDHGSPDEPQIIFFMKKPGQSQDVIGISHKPVSHCEFLSTVAGAMGLKGNYGDTIDDISENLTRKRTYWLRAYDENYPDVPYYDNSRTGTQNVYYLFDYSGDYTDLKERMRSGYKRILQCKDSIY